MKTKLIICDFDGTITREDVLDKICEIVGKIDKSAEINKKYIAGEISGTEALMQRFGLIDGISLDQIYPILSQVELTPGAEKLFAYARKNGIEILVVSGNLDFVINYFRQKLNFDKYICSHIPLNNGKLGSIYDGGVRLVNKKKDVKKYLECKKIPFEAIIAVGDSTSDIPVFDMVKKAFGINWKGKKQDDVQIIESLDQIIDYI